MTHPIIFVFRVPKPRSTPYIRFSFVPVFKVNTVADTNDRHGAGYWNGGRDEEYDCDKGVWLIEDVDAEGLWWGLREDVLLDNETFDDPKEERMEGGEEGVKGDVGRVVLLVRERGAESESDSEDVEEEAEGGLVVVVVGGGLMGCRRGERWRCGEREVDFMGWGRVRGVGKGKDWGGDEEGIGCGDVARMPVPVQAVMA
ncbi:hypothetical protein HDV00_010774 [Rhizophlyctis rosea]|nr:hypothetical protein HDV00_010774 [Rhizophlyctis rosea]